ncbi:MAG: hypothetical protein ABR601_09425 [Parasphingopyxis sp.]
MSGTSVMCVMAALVWTTATARPAAAYHIEPYSAIHEAMTALAEDCVDRYGGDEPYDCSGYYAGHLEYYADLHYHGAVYLRSMSSRWSDDPERMLRGAGAIRFGLGYLSCGSRVRNRHGIDQVGLLCSMHGGQLSFAQAMRSRTDESYAETLAAILDWAGFNYQVARGDVSYQRNFCSYLEERGGPASAALLDGFQSCGEGEEGDGGWTVATLFVQHCSNLISGCREAHGDEARREMRAAALGALLHLIQDSFAQGHVRRTGTGEPFESRITCLPALEFLDIALQHRHADGDRLQILDESCADPATRLVDDPITPLQGCSGCSIGAVRSTRR